MVSGWVVTRLPLSLAIPALSLLAGLAWLTLTLAPLVCPSSHCCRAVVTLSQAGLQTGAKLVLGLAVTVQCSAAPLYISAVAPPATRGTALSLFSVLRNLAQVPSLLSSLLLTADLVPQILATAAAPLLTWRQVT